VSEEEENEGTRVRGVIQKTGRAPSSPILLKIRKPAKKQKMGGFNLKLKFQILRIEIGEPTGFTAYPTSFFGLSFIFF
jgi:hypothetical protein